MQALTTRFLRSPALSTIPIPNPGPGDVLVKVAYVSLNPTDYALAAIALPPSKVVGCDFSGTVTSLGSAVEASSFKIGDRIAGAVHGCRYAHTGAFAEHLVADPKLCYHVPDRVPLEQACTLWVGWISAMQALHQRLYRDDQGPFGCDDNLLIYSAATNTGMHALQQARIEHPQTFIIAIASPQHHDRLRKYGADAVFDYRSASLVEDVRELGRDVRRAIDCHSKGDSTVIAARCMLPNDQPEQWAPDRRRRLIRTLPLRLMSGTVPVSVRADEAILTYTAAGKPFWFLFKYYPAVPEDYEAASVYTKDLTRLLGSGQVVPVNHRLMPGGLGDICKGFEEMRAGRVRGEKLVYRVAGEVAH